jgi:hypothetical protein
VFPWAGALGALVFAGCTLLGSRDVVQCTRDEDCPEARPVCAARLCSARVGVIDAGQDVESPLPQCSRTAECPQSVPTLCVEGRCREARSQACPVLLPAGSQNHTGDGALVIGVYLQSPVSNYARRALELALDQITIALPEPRISALLCAKPADATRDGAVQVIEHLGALKIPLLVGDLETSELVRVLNTARANDVAVWSTLGNHTSVQPPALAAGDAYRFLLDELYGTRGAYQVALDHAITRAAELPDADLASGARVAMVVSNTPEATALANALASADGVTVQGETLASLGPNRFIRREVPPYFERPDGDYAQAIAAVVQHLPHVVIGIGGEEIVRSVVLGIENNWGASSKPVYLLSSRAKYNANDLVTFAGPAGATARARLIGVDFAGDVENHASFVSAGAAQNHSFHVWGFDIFYDAMYGVALSTVLAHADRTVRSTPGEPLPPLTAKDLMKALDSLGDAGENASPVGIGTSELRTAIELLRQGTRVQFRGTTGPWQLETESGTRRMGASLFCFPPGTSTLSFYIDPGAPLDAGACATP